VTFVTEFGNYAAFMDRKSVFICKEMETKFACVTGAEYHEGCGVEVKYHIFLCFEIVEG
jgi:hypothetical protein